MGLGNILYIIAIIDKGGMYEAEIIDGIMEAPASDTLSAS